MARLRRVSVVGLGLCLAGCPRPAPPPALATRVGALRNTTAGDPSYQAERLHRLDQDLLAVGAAKNRARDPYERLRARSARGDDDAQLVLLVLVVRDGLLAGCDDATDRQAFAGQVDALEQALRGPGSTKDAALAFAGPTLLIALAESGRGAAVPGLASQIVERARGLSPGPRRLAEVLADSAYALRRACHLREALALLEDAARLFASAQAPDQPPQLGAVLTLRDLASLRFLLGDAAGAQRALDELERPLLREPAGVPRDTSVIMGREILGALRAALVMPSDREARPAQSAPAPQEKSPGWQALRDVQEQASCPAASPANPRLVRVPLRPPACAATP